MLIIIQNRLYRRKHRCEIILIPSNYNRLHINPSLYSYVKTSYCKFNLFFSLIFCLLSQKSQKTQLLSFTITFDWDKSSSKKWRFTLLRKEENLVLPCDASLRFQPVHFPMLNDARISDIVYVALNND